jgi:hypothetical protein
LDKRERERDKKRAEELGNEELPHLCSSPNIIMTVTLRCMESAEFNMGLRENKCISSFGKKTSRKRPLGRSSCRRESNIKVDITEAGWDCIDWILSIRGTGQLISLQ